MAAALDHFSDRLMAGARTDLLALAKLPFIKSRTAYESLRSMIKQQLLIDNLRRIFWENGFRTIASIANADPKELVPILMQVNYSWKTWG
jgi:hypothetical protein